MCSELEIAELKGALDAEERRTRVCQKEIARLRGVIEEMKSDNAGVEIDIDVSIRSIGDVMEEAWSRAMNIKEKRVSFFFDSYKISIEKEG
jgi:hypothetical protein